MIVRPCWPNSHAPKKAPSVLDGRSNGVAAANYANLLKPSRATCFAARPGFRGQGDRARSDGDRARHCELADKWNSTEQHVFHSGVLKAHVVVLALVIGKVSRRQ
jgi:hypothetical protein